MNNNTKSKKKRFIAFLPVLILTTIAFVSALVGLLSYANNCGSEFNGNHVSDRVVGFLLGAVIALGIALLAYVVALIIAKNAKRASIFALFRIGNYVSFFLLLAGFLFLILDEYSLVGTILYPIVSGTVGDPVDPVLSSSYFTAVGLAFEGCLITLAAGIVMRKVSHRYVALAAEAKTEVVPNE